MSASSSIKDQLPVLKVPSVIRLSITGDVDEDGDTTTTTTSNNTLSSSLTSHFREQQKYRSSSLKKDCGSIRGCNTSSSYYNCTPNKSKSVAVAAAGDDNNNSNIPTCNIVHRALEVMSKSLKDASTNGIDCQQQEAGQSPHQQQQPEDSDGNDDDSGDDVSPSDNSKSDNENDKGKPTPTIASSPPSIRKIAKKRRKEAGRTSFHHTKSSKEYLRKAQEAYQQLQINEPEQQKQQQQQREKEKQELSEALNSSDSDTDPIDYGYGYPDDVPIVPSRSSSTDPIDYGYGDPDDLPSRSSSTDPIDYGYGDPDDVPSRSSSTDPIDYGYGDPDAAPPQQLQHQQSRRGGPARRRNSVTKFSVDAANIVAAKAATQRIMLLKPGLMSLARGHSKNKDSNNKSNRNDNGCKARPSPPQRSRRDPRNVLSYGGDTVVKRCTDLQQMAASQEKQQDEDSSLMQTIEPSTTRNYPLQLTSDYFNSDPKPKSLLRNNSNTSMNKSLRFTTPARTESLLSHDSSFGALSINNNNDDDDDDDDDANSLASDMESSCSMHDGGNSSYRLDNTNNSHNLPPMPPAPPPPPASPRLLSSPLSSASVSTSKHNSSLDHLTHYSSDRSSYSSDHTPTRKSLVISWSNSSNSKDVPFAHLPTDTIRRDSGDKKKTGKYPILPFPTTIGRTTSQTSQTCMPAPVCRTPSNNWQWQREE
jgi:hypothetical protein